MWNSILNPRLLADAMSALPIIETQKSSVSLVWRKIFDSLAPSLFKRLFKLKIAGD